MSSTSSTPRALDALEDLFTKTFATEAITGGAVQWTQGPPQSPERERGEIADVENAAQEWETLGGLVNRSEKYTITCWIIVNDPKHKSVRESKNRAFDLLGIAEEALRVEDPLGLVSSYQYFEVEFGGVTSAKGGVAVDQGWAYELQFIVRVEATI